MVAVAMFIGSYDWKSRVFMMPTLSSLGEPQVVVMTTCGSLSDDKDGIMMILVFLVYSIDYIG